MKVHFIEFDGRSFPLVEADGGQFFVAVRPLCDAIGVRWVGQERKLHRGDWYKSAALQVHSLDAHSPTICIPAIRLFGWFRSFYQGCAKDRDAQQNTARYAAEFIDALEAYLMSVRHGAENTARSPVDENEWRFDAIEGRLDRIEKAVKQMKGGAQ